jgi:hypothetical protein
MAKEGGDSNKGYSQPQLSEFEQSLQKLRDETAGVQMLLHELSSFLTKPRAQTFANQGIGRRLPLVARSARNVFALYPPATREFLSSDECTDVAIQVQAFAINVYAIFDNVAWVCMLEAGGTLSPLKVSLFKKECEPFIPTDLLAYLSQEETKKWFKDYCKLYRDSTAHRIPPYLPPRVYTREEAKQFKELHERSQSTLLEASKVMPLDKKQGYKLLDLQNKLNAEKDALGSNSLMLDLSLTGEDASLPVYLHPQLLCDWGLANELVQTFDRTMRKHYSWPARALPVVRLG